MYRQCGGGLLYYTQDRADAQYEVSMLGSMLVKPTLGSMIAWRPIIAAAAYHCGSAFPENGLAFRQDLAKVVKTPVDW